MASLLSRCALARARPTSLASIRHKTSGRTNARPKRVKLRVGSAGRPAVKELSKQSTQTRRPFRVKDPRYGIAGEGMVEEEATISGGKR